MHGVTSLQCKKCFRKAVTLEIPQNPPELRACLAWQLYADNNTHSYFTWDTPTDSLVLLQEAQGRCAKENLHR